MEKLNFTKLCFFSRLERELPNKDGWPKVPEKKKTQLDEANLPHCFPREFLPV